MGCGQRQKEARLTSVIHTGGWNGGGDNGWWIEAGGSKSYLRYIHRKGGGIMEGA